MDNTLEEIRSMIEKLKIMRSAQFGKDEAAYAAIGRAMSRLIDVEDHFKVVMRA